MADVDRGERFRQAGDDRGQISFDGLTGWLRRSDLRGRPDVQPPNQLALFDLPRRDLGTERLRRRMPRARRATVAGEGAPIRRDPWARWMVVAAVVGYIWLFAYWTTRNHDGLGTQAFDFGIYDQGLWLLSHFQRPFVTVMGRNLFGDHTSFILLFLVPVFKLIPTGKVLLISQAAALGLGGVPVYWLAREKLRDEMLAALLVVAFLLQPVLGLTNLEQFHPDVFEVPLILFAVWFMVKQRWGRYLLCVGLLLLVKEDVLLVVFSLGVYVVVKHDRRIGLITCAASVIYAVLALKWVLPALNGVGSLNGWRIPFGGPAGLLRTSIAHPGRVIEYLTSQDRLWYGWQLFAPLALLALAAPAVLLIGVAALGSNLLSTFPYQHDIHYHYSTMILPVLVAATIFGVASWPSPADRRKLVGLVLAASLVTAYLWGPTPLGRHEAYIADPSAPNVASFHEAARMLPPDAVVSTFYGWLPQIDHRTEVYMFPNPWKASYWGTFKQEGQRLPQADRVQYLLLPSQLDPDPKAVLDSIRGDFETVYDRGGVTLLRRKA